LLLLLLCVLGFNSLLYKQFRFDFIKV